MKAIYADYAATTPCDPRVVQRMAQVMTDSWGNSSSLENSHGRRAKHIIDEARAEIAGFIDAYEDEIIFTSGASESCNMAIKSVAVANPQRQLIVSPTEHPAVIESARAVEQVGIPVHWLRVDANGVIDWQDLAQALQRPSSAVAAMLVNNQTGLVMPAESLRQYCQEAGALWICDITQALPRMMVQIHQLGIDIAMCSAHKLYGPQGSGALYLRRGLHLQPLVHGGGQEASRRSGTENVAGIGGFAEAVKLHRAEASERFKYLAKLTSLLENSLRAALPNLCIFSDGAQRAAGMTYLATPDSDPEIIRRLNGIIVSPGSSCANLQTKPSAALMAMGVKASLAANALRISLSHLNTEVEIARIVDTIVGAQKAD
jgi:cysteine desulfurase